MMSETGPVSELRIARCDAWADAPSAWNELLAASDAETVFLTREWLTAWWTAYGEGRRLVLLSLYDGVTLVAIAPLYIASVRAELGLTLHTLRLVGDGSFDSDHLDVICTADFEPRVVQALCDWLLAHRAEWDILELGSVRESSSVLAALRVELARRGWRFRGREEAHSAIALPPSWDAYLATLSSNMRSTVRRRARVLESGATMSFHRCASEAELPVFLDALFRMHTDRWTHRGQSGSFADTHRRTLYDAIARRALAQGWLRLDRLDVDGVPGAVEFGLRYGDTHSFLQSGFVAELSAQSPGVVLKTRILRELIETGGRTYDFLHGDDAYKQRWSPTRELHRHEQIALPHSAGTAFLVARDLVQLGKTWLYRTIPESVTSPLRRAFRRLRPYRDERTERA